MATASSGNVLELIEPPSRMWLLAVVFFGIGDVVTTVVGLTVGSSAEANPVVAMLVQQYGIVVLLPLKAALLGTVYALWKWLPLPYPAVVPFALAVLGVGVTVWNTGIILTGTLSW
jgi:hypothetical protein